MTPPLIAIVGRPNVGKSTLFNRLVGGRPALVHDTPGLTRDRRYGELEYFGRQLRVVDTGGLDPEAEKDVIGAGIHRQANVAIREAAAVVFVVDAMAGITPLDSGLAQQLRILGKPVFVVGNKVDHPKREPMLAELYSLGLGDVYGISAVHGLGVDDLLQAIVDALGLEAPVPDESNESDGEFPGKAKEDGPIRVAFVGKPNAGKSSLVNRLLGEERALVHDQPGTTTDPVDTEFDYEGRPYVLVDTAGIRRRARIDEATEKISVSMALAQIERADVGVLVVDGKLGPSEQDARLANAMARAGSAVVVALNKADLLSEPGAVKALRQTAKDELHFLSWAPFVLISAVRGDGVADLMSAIDKAVAQHRRRIGTSELNKFFELVCETHPPPLHKGRAVRVHYLTQGRIRPPTFLLFANKPTGMAPSYRRYVSNQLREHYGFKGTPLRVIVRAKSEGKRGKAKGRGKHRSKHRAKKSSSGRSRGGRR